MPLRRCVEYHGILRVARRPVLVRAPGWGRHYLPDSVESLIELYESWGKTDQAEEWRAKLDEAKELARPRTTVGT